MSQVHNHQPYRPACNERVVNGQLRGACLNDDGTERDRGREIPAREREALREWLWRQGLREAQAANVMRALIDSDWLRDHDASVATPRLAQNDLSGGDA